MESNYYQRQVNILDKSKINMLKIGDGKNSTNWLNINDESIPILIKYLNSLKEVK